jgi:hypothetical protein
VSLFDPNQQFSPAPRRATPRRRVVITWSLTGLYLLVLLGGSLLGAPPWLLLILAAGFVAGITILGRRWARRDAARRAEGSNEPR